MTSVEPKKQEPTGNGREPKTGTFLFPTACFLLGCGHRKKTGTAKTDEGGQPGGKVGLSGFLIGWVVGEVSRF